MKILAKKSLGQNFLHSDKALRQIVEASEASPKDLIVEIGPGEGTLTEKLLTTGATVFAVEKDDRLIPILHQKFEKEIETKQLTLIHEDILESEELKLIISKKYKLVANIPYYITGMILKMFLSGQNKPEKIVLLVQKEVAERIVARDGKESILSMSVKLYGTPKIIDTVPRGAFRPIPNVDSAIILIDVNKKEIKKETEEKFFKTIKTAFNQKRKQLGGTIGVTDEQMFLINKNLSAKTRPEELSVYNWLAICDII